MAKTRRRFRRKSFRKKKSSRCSFSLSNIFGFLNKTEKRKQKGGSSPTSMSKKNLHQIGGG